MKGKAMMYSIIKPQFNTDIWNVQFECQPCDNTKDFGQENTGLIVMSLLDCDLKYNRYST